MIYAPYACMVMGLLLWSVSLSTEDLNPNKPYLYLGSIILLLTATGIFLGLILSLLEQTMGWLKKIHAEVRRENS